MAKETLGFRVDPWVIEMLDEIAEQTGESRSEVAERAVKVGVVQIEDAVELLQRPIVGTLLRAVIDSGELSAEQRERLRTIAKGKKKPRRA